jgi:lysozyme
MIDEAQVTNRLVIDEGEVLHEYKDHLGYSTIGVGILIDARKGGGITQEESRYLLRNRIASKTAECAAKFDWFSKIDSVRRQVIVCMAFQLGVNGVAAFRKMCAALSICDYITASIEMLDSQWAK